MLWLGGSGRGLHAGYFLPRGLNVGFEDLVTLGSTTASLQLLEDLVPVDCLLVLHSEFSIEGEVRCAALVLQDVPFLLCERAFRQYDVDVDLALGGKPVNSSYELVDHHVRVRESLNYDGGGYVHVVSELHGCDSGTHHRGVALDKFGDVGRPGFGVLGLDLPRFLLRDVDGFDPLVVELLRYPEPRGYDVAADQYLLA